MGRKLDFECPRCGERKRLKGSRQKADPRESDGAVDIRCLECGHTWVHDPWACSSCGEPMHPERRPLLQKARGTQQSIIGYRIERVCARCDAPEDHSPGWMSATLDP